MATKEPSLVGDYDQGLPGPLVAAISALDSPPRRAVFFLLAEEGPLGFNEIKRRLRVNQGALYRHLLKLQEGGLVDQRIKPRKHLGPDNSRAAYAATGFGEAVVTGLLSTIRSRLAFSPSVATEETATLESSDKVHSQPSRSEAESAADGLLLGALGTLIRNSVSDRATMVSRVSATTTIASSQIASLPTFVARASPTQEDKPQRRQSDAIANA